MRVSSTVDVDESRGTAVVVGILVSFSTRIPFYTEAQATTLHPTRSRGSIRGDFKDVIQLERIYTQSLMIITLYMLRTVTLYEARNHLRCCSLHDEEEISPHNDQPTYGRQMATN